MSASGCVLVVEDEPLIRMDLVDYLSDAGFEVFEAAHADEAIVMLERNSRIQILVTDVDMPGSMDGLKLSRAVRERWPPAKIVVMSGHRAVAVTDMPEGSMFFPKPCQPEALAAFLRTLLA